MFLPRDICLLMATIKDAMLASADHEQRGVLTVTICIFYFMEIKIGFASHVYVLYINSYKNNINPVYPKYVRPFSDLFAHEIVLHISSDGIQTSDSFNFPVWRHWYHSNKVLATRGVEPTDAYRLNLR